MLKKAKEYITHNRLWPLIDVLLFIIITLGFHELWWAFHAQIAGITAFTTITDWLAAIVYNASAWLDAHIFGMDTVLYAPNVIHFNANNTSININESCSGFKQMIQILVLFILFPGPWKHKAWFIPACMAAMFLVNVIRVIGLSYAMILMPQHWDFIHLWIMRPFYYVAIFVMWVIWVEKFRRRK